jgi:hypothetical protein
MAILIRCAKSYIKFNTRIFFLKLPQANSKKPFQLDIYHGFDSLIRNIKTLEVDIMKKKKITLQPGCCCENSSNEAHYASDFVANSDDLGQMLLRLIQRAQKQRIARKRASYAFTPARKTNWGEPTEA